MFLDVPSIFWNIPEGYEIFKTLLDVLVPRFTDFCS